MRIVCEEQAELPFMLNLPIGEYAVADSPDEYVLVVNQEQSAAHYENGQFVIGDLTTLRRDFGSTPIHIQGLRTVVSHSIRVDLTPNEVPAVSDERALEVTVAEMMRQHPSIYLGESERTLTIEAKKRLDSLDDSARAEFLTHVAASDFGCGLADTERFVRNLNKLIRLYMAEFRDQFVEEVTLHQLAERTPIRGISTSIYCSGKALKSYDHVGKFPPTINQAWLKHDDAKIGEFVTNLAAGREPDPVDLMSVRARNCLEKGAFRSAIVEASAALDLCLSHKSREGLRSLGKEDSEIDTLLRQNQRFEDRATTLLNQAKGTTLPALDSTLWSEASEYRTRIHQGLEHSNAEPQASEAEAMVETFSRLAQLIRGIA